MPGAQVNNKVLAFQFSWGAASNIGKLREENEDAYVIEPDVGLFLVSDGMGGHRGGELASKIIIQDLPPMIENRLDKLRSQNPRAIRSLLRKTIAEQSKQLHMEGDSESGYKGMGATVVVVLFVDGRAYVANVGDSRIYRFRKQFSKDHSIIAKLLEKGRITEAQAQSHQDRGVITRYVGMEEKARPYVRSFLLKKRDRLLLCTDGLTDMVDNTRVAAILNTDFDCQTTCNKLIEAANSAGGVDNITVVLVEWRG
jgi:serine/threonine protein phosphatase PrpC